MNQYPEDVLIDLAVRNNDQLAFGELVKRNQNRIRHSLRQLSNWNEALADDLAQDTFIKAFKGLHRFNQKSKFSSWLYRIAYNEFLQHCRSNQSQKNYAEFELLENHQIEDSSPPPAAAQASHGLQEQLAVLLGQLEPERRSVLHLMLHRQNTQQEIADIMGIPLGTVKTHISRGRIDLQKKLADWQD